MNMSKINKDNAILKTERLILRQWVEDDALGLYRYAKDPRVGPIAGWYAHNDVEYSREIINEILAKDEIYAIVPIGDDSPIGSIGLLIGERSNLPISSDEGEIGYWIGVPYWGKGLVPEAVRELMRHGFVDLGLKIIWCGYFDGNEKSKRVQEKCGFLYHHTDEDMPWPMMDDIRTLHVTCITREQWEHAENNT